jgi:photosystem II stability/assembly factor-like uncharacterized protein
MKKVFLLILLFPLQLPAQYNWQALSNAPKSWRNDDVYFLTPTLGWATHAYYDYLSPNQFGQIYKTTDGGSNWQLIKDSSTSFYRSIGFADSLTGWVGNLADTNPYYGVNLTKDTVPLYQTNDGGKTWSPVILPNPHPVAICGISVVNDSVIYAYGRWNSKWTQNNVGYIKTTDKGKTWVYHDMSAYCFGMVDGWFFNKDTGFLSGASPAYKAQILSTTDGGNTWQVCYRSTRVDTDEVWKIFFPHRDTGYAAIEYQANVSHTANRYFAKTIDGGKTWTELPFLTYYDEEGIGFINDTIGWIGGDYKQPTYITFNGGKTWAPDNNFGVSTPPYNTGSGYAINRFRKLNDTLMYASGNTVYKLSGTITGIEKLNPPSYSAINYPNPFSTETTIEYNLKQACNNIKISIYSSHGQIIYTQNINYQSAGKHDFKFNQDIASGAYFYSITSDEFTITRQMIRTK